jgi:hypothetical protein
VAGRGRFRIGGKDHQTGSGGTAGAFVCQEPKAGKKDHYTAGVRVGFLPEGSEVTVGETRGEWGHIKAITAGGMISVRSEARFGSDDLNNPWTRPDDEGDECTRFDPHAPGEPKVDGNAAAVPLTPEGDWGWINLHDQRALKEPKEVGKVVIPSQPIHVKAGTLTWPLQAHL